MNYQELEPFRNQQRALASIASQFLIAGYTLEDALKQADYMLIKSDEYLNDQAIEDHYDDENREYFRIQFTIKHVQKELKLSSTTMIYRHLSKFLDEKGIALIKSKARRQEVAFSQDYICLLYTSPSPRD